MRDQPELSAGRKIVLLLDQFEPWLDAHRQETEDDPSAALRLCDGSRLQAVVMVHTEFLDSALRAPSPIRWERAGVRARA